MLLQVAPHAVNLTALSNCAPFHVSPLAVEHHNGVRYAMCGAFAVFDTHITRRHFCCGPAQSHRIHVTVLHTRLQPSRFEQRC
jgi:hypothetical protein